MELKAPVGDLQQVSLISSLPEDVEKVENTMDLKAPVGDLQRGH
jgi:hypothetical protein